MWLHFGEERRKKSLPLLFYLCFCLFHFLSPPHPSVCARRAVCSPAPPSFHFLEGQIVHFEIWLTCFQYDIRPLFYKQPPAKFLGFTAGFKHQQLSFSRPVVCAVCAHRHIALQKRGMRDLELRLPFETETSNPD